MKFSDSLGARGVIANTLDHLVMNSSASRNPEAVMDVDTFFDNLSQFHDQSINGELKELVNNHNQPIFDFNEIKVLAEQQVELEEIAATISLDDGIEL